MIKLAVIDQELNTRNKKIHTIKSDGILHSINPNQSKIKIHDNDNLVVVVNLNLKGEHSMELLKHIKFNKTKICLLITHEDHELQSADSVLTSAHWIIYNNKENNSLKNELNQVIYNGKAINGRITRRIINFISKNEISNPVKSLYFSKREVELMRFISTGKTNKEAAIDMGITLQTVKNHLKHIYSKFNVSTRNEAISMYIKLNQ